MRSGEEKENSDLLATGAALSVLADMRAQQVDPLVGTTLGDYCVVDRIAEGGMSSVYLGERTDGSFDRQVAIKVPPASTIHSDLRERFLREQGMLASLTHPHITRLYDARVTDGGRPYIVMELVHGMAIDTFCRERGLGARQVVDLVIQVVDAIAYAHARLIVHRDIKPSNVMVDEDGSARVLDFGIAKLLDAEANGETNAAFMTPRSASPEQLLGRPITVASDIYQVGLLLYELLTGTSPFAEETLEDVIRRAAEARPVTFDAQTRGKVPAELLLIIGQCLRDNPAERYPDANTLRSDLEAFLSGHPVRVVGRGPVYRFRKFVGRNTAASAISAIALLILITGTLWYTYSLSAARQIAEKRADTSSRLTQAMSALITETFEGFIDHNAQRQVGSAAVVEAALQSTAERIRAELAAEPEARGELLLVQSDIERTLGHFGQARRALEEAQQLASEVDGRAQMEILLKLAGVSHSLEDVESAREYVDAAGVLFDAEHFGPEIEAGYLHELGSLYLRESRFDEAEATFEQALSVLAQGPGYHGRKIADLLMALANLYMMTYDHEAMLESAEGALETIEETESEYSSRLVAPLRLVGWARVMLDDLPGARTAMERAMAIAVGNFGEAHGLVATVHNSMGLLAYYEKHLWEAIDHAEEGIRIGRTLYGPDNPDVRSGIGNLGMLYTDVGEMEKAGALLAEQMAWLDPDKVEDRSSFLNVTTNEARRLNAIGDYENAARLHEQRRAIRVELYGPDSIEVADAEDDMALAHYQLGRYEEAERWFMAGLEKYRLHEGEASAGYQDKFLYTWRYDLLSGDLVSARDKLYEIMMEDVEKDELDAIWPVHMFTDLANLNLRLGDMERARQALDWAALGAATAPPHPSAYYASLVEAEYQLAVGNIEAAAEHARNSLEGFEVRYPLLESRAARARAVLNALE